MDIDQTDCWPFTQIQPYCNYLITEGGLAENTILAYRRDLYRFGGYCENLRLTDPNAISPCVLQDYARHLYQFHLATASIARYLVAVRMFLRYHLLMGLVDQDVCSAMETPKTWKRLPRVLSQRRTIELIEAVDPQSRYYQRDRALLELLYATGMRASEAAGLQIENINFQIGYLRCLGKGKRERIIPVHQLALKVVGDYMQDLRGQLLGEKPDPGHLFLSRTARPLSRIEIWRIVRGAAENGGLVGQVTPHTLRHCFGSHLLQGGADLRNVQEMLGHTDITTTQIYTHVDQQHLRSVHKKFHPRP